MANEQPNNNMQEQFEQLRQAISKDFSDQMALQLGVAKSELGADIKVILTEQLDSAKADLKQFVQVRFEELKDHVKMTADGYGATLESVDRRLKELLIKWDTKIRALALPATERASVAAELLASLDDPVQDNLEAVTAAWAEETERRARRALNGDSAGESWGMARERTARRLTDQ